MAAARASLWGNFLPRAVPCLPPFSFFSWGQVFLGRKSLLLSNKNLIFAEK